MLSIAALVCAAEPQLIFCKWLKGQSNGADKLSEPRLPIQAARMLHALTVSPWLNKLVGTCALGMAKAPLPRVQGQRNKLKRYMIYETGQSFLRGHKYLAVATVRPWVVVAFTWKDSRCELLSCE